MSIESESDQPPVTSEAFSEAAKIASFAETPETGAEAGPEREEVLEQAQSERGGILRDALTSAVVSNGLDLVPFVGGGKMLAEAIAGNTLDGEEVSGKSRVIHAAMGAGSLALDFTGIGEVREGALVAGRSITLIGKLAAGLSEKGALKAAYIFERSAAFMASHPELTAQAELAAESKIRAHIQNIKTYREHGSHPDETEAA